MAKQSAGLVLYRRSGQTVEVLLVHPGGPFWAKRDKGAWSIPKGEFSDDEDGLTAAKREFSEELGTPAPAGECLELGSARQKSGKVVHAWALESDLETKNVTSNTFEMEWPPKSGQMQTFPEVDRAGWFGLGAAQTKLVSGQMPLLEILATKLGLAMADAEPAAKGKTAARSKEQTSLF